MAAAALVGAKYRVLYGKDAGYWHAFSVGDIVTLTDGPLGLSEADFTRESDGLPQFLPMTHVERVFPLSDTPLIRHLTEEAQPARPDYAERQAATDLPHRRANRKHNAAQNLTKRAIAELAGIPQSAVSATSPFWAPIHRAIRDAQEELL